MKLVEMTRVGDKDDITCTLSLPLIWKRRKEINDNEIGVKEDEKVAGEFRIV